MLDTIHLRLGCSSYNHGRVLLLYFFSTPQQLWIQFYLYAAREIF